METRFAEYVRAHRERFRQEASERAALAAQAWEAACRAGASLVGELGAARVLLIGSLARGDFRLGSDIDLVVEGLAPQRFFAACAAADRLGGIFAVDLVPFEDASALTRRRLASEGKEIARAS
ncbi:MAG: nucleotidyltransferase domain-containing protein [Deltaproteobacteria bacterium]|nr:nucleotidyltransferase domain-containing protein [Deltaproteobacteria bacterium]